MPDSDKKIKHFIFTRFFPQQDPKYPHDVLDANFLSTQLVIAQNILNSLENQTNKNFELLFLMNPKYFEDSKYEFIFSTLKDSTTLPLVFIKTTDISQLVRDAFENYDFVIQSRMDFDDFIFKDAVANTQSKVAECENILVYGYCKGYVYVYLWKELYAHKSSWVHNDEPLGHLGILQSVILKSSFAKNLPFIGVYGSHGKIKLRLKNYLKTNGIVFSESMFQQNTSADAYIYFRSEYSHVHLTRNLKFKVPKVMPLSTKDITKKRLYDEFGFHLELNSIK